MGYQWKAWFQRCGWLRRRAVERHATELVDAYDIKVSGPDQLVGELSGGNLQKVVVARELAHEAPLLVVEQPTRGLDVAAIEFIHGQLIAHRDAGRGVLLVSAELCEILALSTRILVMFEGRIVAELDPHGTDEAEIGLHMTGAKEHAVRMPEPRAVGGRLATIGTSPVTAALVLAFVICAVIILVSGENPLSAYAEMWRGATSGSGPRTVINRAIPIVGMALAISIPFRAGIVNLGGEGQMVVGGLAAALTAIYLPAPGSVALVASFVAGAAAGALWAPLPALGQTTLQLPILISSLLLNAPARALTSYLVKYYFGDPTATSTTTVAVPEATRIPTLGWLSDASASVLLVLVLVMAVALFNPRTAPGYESLISGINLRFARYGGVNIARQTIASMAVGGAIAGIIGAHLVLGQSGRFVDGDLVGTGFAWTGLLVSLLAFNRPLPILLAGTFFAALQVGGLAMQRSANVSWQLAQVLQAVVILTLATGFVPSARRWRRRGPSEEVAPVDAEPIGQVAPEAPGAVRV